MPIADQIVVDNITPYLHEGEELKHFAYGVKQPNIWLMILLFCCGIIPGVVFVAIGTKEFYVALTDRRLLIMRVRNMKRVIEGSAMEYDLGAIPPTSTSAGSIFAHMRIKDPERPFVAKFHRMGMKNNREQVTAMGEAIAAA
jgi:hypothetical protein